ncbi:MAG: DUF3592 domain-containing protein [Pseudomonadota bacterium]
MKGKLFLILFSLPFAGVGLWMGWSIAGAIVEHVRMQGWQPAQAQLEAAGYETHHGDESTTYKAYARYRYSANGQSFRGERVSIFSGNDNIGSYQQDTGRRLQLLLQNSQPVVVYFDPDQPAESIIDRDLRWGMVGFRSIFFLVFGGVGIGLLIVGLRAPAEKDPDDPTYADAPWLANDDWQTPSIRSRSRMAMWGIWGFAALWNLISAPLPFLIVDEVTNKSNFLALVGLLFPLVGIGMLVWAIRRTLEWKTFGATPVELDPFPGAIGGHVGGHIDLRVPYDATHRFQLSLTSLHHYTSGSGKNRSRREKALWQRDLQASAQPGPLGTRLFFRFDVPEGLNESDARESGDSYFAWRLSLTADLPGTDLNRDYAIPVYATAAQSKDLPELALAEATRRQDRLDEADVVGQINLTHTAGGKRLHLPVGRNAGTAFVGFLIGSAFAAAGYFILTVENQVFMGVVFGLLGTAVAIGSFYAALNSLTVELDGGRLRSVRRLLGVPLSTREMPVHSVSRISKDSSFQANSGGKHVMHYSIYAHDAAGNKLTLGEGFKGSGDADAAIRVLSREFGIRVPGPSAPRSVDGDIDFLAADS